MSDDEQVARFGALYLQYGQSMVSYFCSKGFERDMAWDMTHDVFLACLSIPPESIEYEKAYLWTSARNLASQKRRRSPRQPDQGTESLNEEFHHSSLNETPEQVADDTFTTEFLNQAISRLSPGKQALLKLRLAGYQDAQIAARLHLPVGTVQSQFTQIRVELRRILVGDSGRETA